MKEATVEKIAEEVRAARLAADAKVKEGLAALSKAVERMRAGLERAERALERHANAESSNRSTCPGPRTSSPTRSRARPKLSSAFFSPPPATPTRPIVCTGKPRKRRKPPADSHEKRSIRAGSGAFVRPARARKRAIHEFREPSHTEAVHHSHRIEP